MKNPKIFLSVIIIMTIIVSVVPASYSQVVKGSRPGYVYDNSDVISNEYELLLDSYLRKVDAATSVEIVIWTIPSFYGHGIEKDGVEIHERDMLAHHIFNEMYLNGIKGIGKEGKDNGILILLSREKDSLGGSMRIEVGRGLEGVITDGTAGEILDAYLVPARNSFLKTQDTLAFDHAFMNTVSVLAEKAGYVDNESIAPHMQDFPQNEESDLEKIIPLVPFIILFVILFVLAQKKKKSRGFYGGFGGWFGGGSGGGGAGR
ncbi:MAG: TPM domain-containing protein [Nitrosopumilus sp.]|nr:TPM domain-containing protein [Nitrosopumilus sp.]